jgi:heterodisulfide reductase subunit A-like polyferredoxin
MTVITTETEKLMGNGGVQRDAVQPVGAALVVGGGIAGVQTSLDLAASGFFVYLVEKSPAIGGVMAQLDKTFPTNDCSMCILSPKLVECGRHPNIQVLTLTEVEQIEGEAGHFQVTLKRQPRYIDLGRCTACGDCAQVCPVTMPSEFDRGLGPRKAAYKPYAQAIPGGYAIDKRDRSPCTNGCPNGVNAHAYVALIAQGKYREAMEVILRTLPFPGVIGRICPHPCESACRRGQVDAPVAICALKRFVADRVDIESLPVPDIEKREEKVAVIGSGPAGLTAAYFLALEGYRITVFEARPVAGGMLRVGIPDYRLPPAVLDKEIRAVTRLGVEIKLNTALGRDVTVEGLFSQGFKAVYVAIGAHQNLRLKIPGEDAEGVLSGVEFLRRSNLGAIAELSGRVVIVGGGDVAIDAARSALRLGADKVTILYRRTRVEMPAREAEVEDALAEGIEIQYLTAPQRVLTKDNRVSGIECIKMELGEPDSSGRRRPIPVAGSEFVVETDWVLPAIGQAPGSAFLEDQAGVTLARGGTVLTDPVTLATNVKGVFAGGDAQGGPWIAIGAVAHGREAATSISRYLRGEDMQAGREPVEVPQLNFVSIPEGVEKRPRAEMPVVAMAARQRGFTEVELGLTEEQANAEALRCLNCMSCCECLQCVSACKAGAVDHSMQPEVLTVDVGSVVLSPGYETFDPNRYEAYGYGRLENVVTSLEFERILSASGPFMGHLVRPSDRREPEKIAWIQCVGSRDINHWDKGYCSAVCCMYAIKQAVIAKEHAKKGLDAAIFFMDMRTFGKDFEKYYNRARDDYGVRFIRSRIHTLYPESEGRSLMVEWANERGEILAERFDMVVLSVGVQMPAGAVALAERLGIELGRNDFAASRAFLPVSTSRPGIYACGMFQGPKDIPQSVTEASAAASAAAADLAPSRGSLVRVEAPPPELDFGDAEPRIGVFVCNCGINIGSVVDVNEVVRYAAALPHVVHAEANLFTCSQDTQERTRQNIRDKGLSRVVVAACSPRTHEPLFQETLKACGLNRYLFEMANIRDQDSWVHQTDPARATAKAKDLVRMAVARAARLKPLAERKLEINPRAVVIGGGVAGLNAALMVARQGFEVVLVEKARELGGMARRLRRTIEGFDVHSYLERLISEVRANPRIQVLTEALVVGFGGQKGNFTLEVLVGPGMYERKIQHGAVIVATGAQEYRPQEYLYGEDPRVMTQLELGERLSDGECARWRRVVMIQCVGSRQEDRPNCSRICCQTAVKNALELKRENGDLEIIVLYRDMRTYGFLEEYYTEARREGVLFSRFSRQGPPQVSRSGEALHVAFVDHVLQRPVTVAVDAVILSAATVAADVDELASHLKLPVNSDGFFIEAHAKLRPVDFPSEGIYLCGTAHSPMLIREAIAQALAAASRASSFLASTALTVGGAVARVDQSRCAACLVCVMSCPYGVPRINEDNVSEIDEAMCHGCGICSAECPAKAIELSHYQDDQIDVQLQAVLEGAL